MSDNTPSKALVPIEAGGTPQGIVPSTTEEVTRFASIVARSGLAPYGMDTPEKVAVAIMIGLEMGVKPMQAINGIAVVNGRPMIWGDLANALIEASGLLEEMDETMEGEEPEDWVNPKGKERNYKAVCTVTRKGKKKPIRREFSISDAILGKLWMKKSHQGKDTPWVTSPKRMLQMRARAFALRDAFADVLKGMVTREEMIGSEDDIIDGEARAVANAPPKIENDPAPPAATATAAEAVQADDVTDAEIVDHGAILSQLSEALLTCSTEDALDAAWGEFEADVNAMPRDLQDAAQSAYEGAQRRISAAVNAAAGEAKGGSTAEETAPATAASDDPPPPPDEQEEAAAADDAPPPVEEKPKDDSKAKKPPVEDPEATARQREEIFYAAPSYVSQRSFREHFQRAIDATHTVDDAKLLRAKWEECAEYREDLPDDTVKEVRTAVRKRLKAVETPPEDKGPDKPAADPKAEYFAEHARRIASATDGVELEKWWFAGSDYRTTLVLSKSEKADLRDRLFEKAKALQGESS